MISPEILRKRSLAYYHNELLRSIVLGGVLFPWEISIGKVLPEEILKNPSLLRELRAESKENKGFGFRIVFRSKETRKYGIQTIPTKIVFDTEDDFLRFTKKKDEFLSYSTDCALILSVLPELKDWILKNTLSVIEESGKWESILSVCSYFLEYRNPGLYIRELPIRIPTKFIEENKKVLRSLLDFLLPEIADAKDFETRYGLKKAEPLVRFRILDLEIAKSSTGGLTDLSIPVRDFRKLELSGCRRVFILENKTNFANLFNFLSFPQLKGTISIFGQGFGLNVLKDCNWLEKMEIFYWGDLDVQGFEILSQLREQYPQSRSFLMDLKTFVRFRDFAVDGISSSKSSEPKFLTPSERETWKYLSSLDSKNRLEQEKIPHEYVQEVLSGLDGSQ
ncbi:PF09983 family protein [Leptospira santarosai str. CBC523]|uniref:Wadjet anti-phage system protein JetD domain-containing protein n=1 Tax=Leptospira santarosai TaxID=28183 RepID=UPI0002C0331E|nr:Wadjet anti-phage system protein JetD domain-containing protein [Leptospira santarosai]EMO14519.1 PF09983 family protein [Leptospira santarosai str. CBC523]